MNSRKDTEMARAWAPTTWSFISFVSPRLVAQALAVALLGGLALSARAQDDDLSDAPPSTQQTDSKSSSQKAVNSASKRTQINFEDQLVEGQAQKPELFYLLQQRNANFKRLIRLRDDFLPEMRKTADEIQRKGSVR